VKRIVETCHKRATEILKKNRKFLKIMAEALLDREILDSTDVDDIMAGRKLGPKPAPKTPTSNTPSTPTPATVSPKVVLKPQAAPSAIEGGKQIG